MSSPSPSACSDLPAFVLPRAEVLPSFWCPKPTHEVWINQGLICGTDKDFCAEMIAMAINHWRHTDEGKAWWKERQRIDQNEKLCNAKERQ